MQQIDVGQPIVIPLTVELVKALETVVNLAEGNCLDPTDPDMDNDGDLLQEANRQWAAIDTVNGFLSLLASTPDKPIGVLVATVG